MEAENQVCLRWNNHQNTLVSVFGTLFDSGTLVDCTIAAEGRCLKAHRVILSSCSPFFASVFSQHYEKHPVVVLKDVTFQELRAIMDYMYRGEVDILEDQLGALLQAAKSLQIKGLSDSGEVSADAKLESEKRKQTCAPIQEGSALPEQYAKCPGNPQFQRESEVVDLSDDSLPSPQTQGTLCTKVHDSSPANHTHRTPHSFSGCHEQEIGNSYSTTKNRCSSFCNSSNSRQTDSVVSLLTSTAAYESVLEENLPEVLANTPAQIKKENAPLPPQTPLPQRFKATTVTSDGHLQKQVTHSEMPIKSESVVMDTDSDFADDISCDFMLIEKDYTEHHGEKSSPNRMDFLSTETSVEGVDNCTSDVFSALPKSKRPCPSKCGLCGKVYKYNRSLASHLKYECGKEPQFQCPYCPARYTQNGNLKKHLEKNHNLDSEKQYATP